MSTCWPTRPRAEEAVSLIVDLLAAAPGVKVLVTSRASLRVQGEHLYPVQGLQVPPGPLARLGSRPATPLADPEQAMRRYSAIGLFRQGAQQVRPEFRAAPAGPGAGGPHLPPGRRPAARHPAGGGLGRGPVAGRDSRRDRAQPRLFGDGPARRCRSRQRSMRAVFDYSWRLLDERERDIFQGLSVFLRRVHPPRRPWR